MDLPLLLRDPATGACRRVLVRAPEGTPFDRVGADLARVAGVGTDAGTRARAGVDVGVVTGRGAGSSDPGGGAVMIDGRTLAAAARLGAPPLVDGAELTWVRRPGGATTPTPVPTPLPTPVATGAGAVELRVVAGPDAGSRHVLGPGTWVLGRGAAAHVRLSDPGLSRRHAVVDVTADGVTVADLGSTNGTTTSGHAVGAHPQSLGLGVPVVMASTAVTLATAHPAGPPTAPPAPPLGDGTLGVNRAPRVRQPRQTPTVHLPAPPAHSERPRFSVLVLALPLAVSAAAAAVLRSPVYLAFGLLGPAMSLAQYLTDRRRHRERSGEEGGRHAAALGRTRSRVAWLLDQERLARRRDCPDLATLAAVCAGAAPELWCRRVDDQDWLELALGQGRVPARTQLRAPDGRPQRLWLSDVPVTVALSDCGVLGIAPGRDDDANDAAGADRAADATGAAGAAGLARALLAQAVAWHGPRDLHIVVLAASQDDLAAWDWLCWSPHARETDSPYAVRAAALDHPDGVARLVADLLTRLDEPPQPARGGGAAGWDPTTRPTPTRLVLLVGATALRDVPGVARLLRDGPARSIHAICLAGSAETLPVECRTIVTTHGVHATLATADDVRRLRPDGLPAPVARAIGRALGPLRDVTPGAGREVPALVRLPEVSPGDPFDAAAQADRWRRTPADTVFPLGLDAAGVAELDLRRDGPHALVAGTTGAGKSELLRALVVALAQGNRPDRLAFVLVDYKGGSAFDACARLPHTVGLVTDLDAADTRRALTGLEAELRGREECLRAAGAADLDGYAALVDAGAAGPGGRPLEHLPRLVIVVDEFRALAEELPDFVAGLVRLAALGRSLGLHLVLATQRPAGIVSADMRANLALRIALRVRDAADSLDIVETPQAAALSSRHPGRAVVRTGQGEPRMLQTTYLGPHAAAGLAAVEVRRAEAADVGCPIDAMPLLAAVRGAAAAAAGAPAPGQPGAVTPVSDLDRVTETLRAATALVGAQPPASPWLPPLPTDVRVADLPALALFLPGEPPLLPGEPPPRPCEAPLAPTLLADDPTRQRRRALAWDPGGGHLAVIGRPGSGRSTALATLLTAALQAACPGRLTAYVVDAGAHLAPLAAFPHVGAYLRVDEVGAIGRLVGGLRDASRRGPGEASPARLLVVDGWEQLRATLDRIDHGGATEDLLQLVRSGGGLTLLVAGGRELLSGPLSGQIPDRVVLDLADPTDAYLAGLEPRSGPALAGRAHLTWCGLQAQVARHGEATAELALGARTRHRDCPGPAWRIRSLPAVVGLADLLPPARAAAVTLGLAGDGSPAELTLDGRGVLIAGPRGSGRTTALDLIASGLRRAGRPCLLLSARSPALGAADLAALLAANPATVCLVDDVEAIGADAVEDVLLAHAQGRDTGSVVATGTLGGLLPLYRGLVGALRRSTYGLVLSPGPRGAELFGLPLPEGEPPVPGRGYLVEDHRVVAVQVALPSAGPGQGTFAPPSVPAMHPAATAPTTTAVSP